MQDLNDLYLYAMVVANEGFSPAARATGIPKSKLSKHVAKLEARLGVRLLERSTRRFRVTDIGREFYARCQAVLAGAEAAEAVVAEARAEPRGTVRVSCPAGLTPHLMSDVLPDFLAAHPEVRVHLSVINRRIDLIEEGFDVALRVRERLDTDTGLTMRALGSSRLLLAASPGLLAALDGPVTLESLPGLPTLTPNERRERDTWRLEGPDGRAAVVEHAPRLCCGDFEVLLEAAVAGLGVALLPEHVANQAFHAGTLVRVLPAWSTPNGTVHMVFTGRQGLLPAVRAFIDHLARSFPDTLRRCQEAGGGASAALPNGAAGG